MRATGRLRELESAGRRLALPLRARSQCCVDRLREPCEREPVSNTMLVPSLLTGIRTLARLERARRFGALCRRRVSVARLGRARGTYLVVAQRRARVCTGGRLGGETEQDAAGVERGCTKARASRAGGGRRWRWDVDAGGQCARDGRVVCVDGVGCSRAESALDATDLADFRGVREQSRRAGLRFRRATTGPASETARGIHCCGQRSTRGCGRDARRAERWTRI